MKFKLKTEGKVKYSKGEQASFKALSTKPRSSNDIVKVMHGEDAPFNGRKILIVMIKSLRRKMLANKEPFKIVSSKRNGPHAMEFWLEAK